MASLWIHRSLGPIGQPGGGNPLGEAAGWPLAKIRQLYPQITSLPSLAETRRAFRGRFTCERSEKQITNL